jgi:hypothetical protein
LQDAKCPKIAEEKCHMKVFRPLGDEPKKVEWESSNCTRSVSKFQDLPHAA